MNPPICKLIDFKKFLYENKKKQKKINYNKINIRIKEIRFGPKTEEHDYEFKKTNARKFLEKGAKVKSLVLFKGRSIIYKEQGKSLLLRLAHDLQDCSQVAKMPYMEGKRMFLILIPINKLCKN